MTDPDDDYVYVTGEWRPASEVATTTSARAIEVRDASGNVLADGDSVVLIQDLKVKGAGQTLKQGTVIRSIRLTDHPEERSTAGTTQLRDSSCEQSSCANAEAGHTSRP